jgi:DNA modification methylase
MQGEGLSYEVLHGDCREVMAGMDADSVHAVVTSPPYAMQRAKQYGGVPESDYPEWAVQWMQEVHRVLVPQGSVIINIR